MNESRQPFRKGESIFDTLVRSRDALDKIGDEDWTPQDYAHQALVRSVLALLESGKDEPGVCCTCSLLFDTTVFTRCPRCGDEAFWPGTDMASRDGKAR